MKKSASYVSIAVLVVIAILAIAFVASQTSGGASSTSSSVSANSSTSANSTSVFSTNSVQAGNRTYVATFQSTLNTPTALLNTTSITSQATGHATSSTTTYTLYTQTTSTGGAFTYTPSSQVKVLSVAATVTSGGGGDDLVTFSARFQNIGSGTIYVMGGGGSSLTANIESGPGVTTKTQQERCLVVTAMVPVEPGQEYTSITPGCWSGYYYVLTSPGTVTVQLTLTWSTGTTSSQSNQVVITAQLDLS